MMDRARAAHLISGDLAGDEADQAEDVSQGRPGPDLSEANAPHGGDLRTRSEAVVVRRGDASNRGVSRNGYCRRIPHRFPARTEAR